MKKYRLIAVAVSVFVHLLVLLIGKRFVLWEPSVSERDEAIVYLRSDISRQPKSPQRTAQGAFKKRVGIRAERKAEEVHPPVASDTKGVETVPASPLLQEHVQNQEEDIERKFFGDSLYTILKGHPELRPLILQQLLVQNAGQKDSLETLRQQLADAVLSYQSMSDAERAARANMKRFGTANNPFQVPAIPGNIPITQLILFLISLITK